MTQYVNQIVWAFYDLNQVNQNRGLLKIPRKVNLEIIKPFKETKSISCKEADKNCDTCLSDGSDYCELLFKNYTGIFRYYENDRKTPKEVLVLHKKICKIMGFCGNSSNCSSNCPIDNGPTEAQIEFITEKYSHFFEKLVFNIIKNLSEHLPFCLASPLSSYVKEYDYVDNEFLKFLVIYHKIEEIKSGINDILCNPHRMTTEISTLRRYDEVNYVDIDVITDIIQNPHRLVKNQSGCIKINNQNYYPTYVTQYELEESFDTLENRYIKNLLCHLIEVIEKNKILRKTKDNRIKEIKEINDLYDTIKLTLGHTFFSEVGITNKPPLNSQVLLKQTGYRELFIVDRLMRVILVPTYMNEIDMYMSLKRMDVIWELYVFSEIIKAIRDLDYKIKESSWDEIFEKDESYDYAKFVFDKLSKEVKISYQETIKVGKSAEGKLRPDFLLKCDNRKIVIDAKYMIKENVNTGDLSKYLTSIVKSKEDSLETEKLSDAVFAACLRDIEDYRIEIKSFTHLFDDNYIFNDNHLFNYNHPSTRDALKYIINLFLLDEVSLNQDCSNRIRQRIREKEQFIGYITISLPRI